MSECFRCGQEGHRRSECPGDTPLPAADSARAPSAGPSYLDAGAYRRPAWEISEPTEEYRLAREKLGGHGMPDWLRKRMTACQQVADSRRDPLNLRNRTVMANIRK